MRAVFECSLIILTEDQNWKLHILHNCIHQHDPTKISLGLKVYSKTLNSCKFNLWELFFFLGITLSFTHNFAPKTIKPKTMDRKTKAFSGILPCSSPSRIQFSIKEAPPTESFVCKNLVLKICTRRKSCP